MNRFITLTFFLLLANARPVLAQDFSLFNQVIGSTGHYAVEGNQRWSYTVGEVTIQTFTSNGRTLTQGFHQPEFSRPVSVTQPDLASWGIEVFPNPTTEVLNIRFDAAHPGTLEAQVFDLYGRLLLGPQPLDAAAGLVSLSCSDWLPGVYVLHLLDRQTMASTSLRFVRL
jgi:hypothetical protein